MWKKLFPHKMSLPKVFTKKFTLLYYYILVCSWTSWTASKMT